MFLIPFSSTPTILYQLITVYFTSCIVIHWIQNLFSYLSISFKKRAPSQSFMSLYAPSALVRRSCSISTAICLTRSRRSLLAFASSCIAAKNSALALSRIFFFSFCSSLSSSAADEEEVICSNDCWCLGVVYNLVWFRKVIVNVEAKQWLG